MWPHVWLSSQEEEAQDKTGEPPGIATIHAVAAANVTDVVRAKEAAED